MSDESRGGDVFNEERLCRLVELMKEHDLEHALEPLMYQL